MSETYQVYFVPISHHDLGYTHTIDQLLQEYCKYYDDVLDFCDQTSNYPFEAQYRYSVEEFWSVDHYLHQTTQENKTRFANYVRQGRIEIPALYANVIDGICSEEELTRAMYPSAAYANEVGVPIQVASLTDIPGMSDGTIQTLSQAGVRYLFAGFPQYFRWADCTGKKPNVGHSFWNEDIVPWGHPAAFYWQSASGGKVFTWFQDGYGWFGDDEQALYPHGSYEEIAACLPRFVQQLKNRGCPYGIMRYIYHGSDNEAPDINISHIVKRWNEVHSDIKLCVATNTMFFEALERELSGQEIPVLRGEVPHTDYSVLSLSEAQTTALNAQTKNRVLSVQALLSMTSKKNQSLVDQVYKAAILYDEHCFGMDKSCGYENQYNRSLKLNYAYDAARKTDEIWTHAATIQETKQNGYTLFSPSCGHGIATVISENEALCTANTPVCMTTMQGNKLYVQRDRVISPLLPIYGLPEQYAMKQPGSNLYEYTIGTFSSGLSLQEVTTVEKVNLLTDTSVSNTLENQYYRIELNVSGNCITGIYDKQLGKYITDGSPVGEVIARDIERNKLHRSNYQSLIRHKRGPVADSVLLCLNTYSAPQIHLEVTLYHTCKRIDFAYRICLDQTPYREMYLCFPLQVQNPRFFYQGRGTRLEAFRDTVPGGNTNHYDVGEYVLVTGDDLEIALASEQGKIAAFGGIHPTAVSHAHHWLNPDDYDKPFVKKEGLKHAHVYAFVAYNNCRTNFPVVQQGDVIYKYSITSGKTVCPDMFARQITNPPVLLEGKHQEFNMEIAEKSILPICLKPAQNGIGHILRLKESCGQSSRLTLSLQGHTIVEAFLCTPTETVVRKVNLEEFYLKPFETVTLKICFE